LNYSVFAASAGAFFLAASTQWLVGQAVPASK